MEQFDEMILDKFKCELHELSKEKIEGAGLLKAQLVDWVYLFAEMYCKTTKFNVSEMSKVEELNDKVILNQDKVIILQEQLIKSKEEQLQTLQSSVRDEVASVQTTVKSELQTWSEVVKRNTVQSEATFSSAKLKDAVRSAVDEEDRSRNFVIFNKEEEADEDLVQTVEGVLLDINEKPMIIDCRRIGKTQPGKARPIKVKLSSSDAVSHILRRAKALKTSERNKKTFLAPDRTVEEREVHRALVVRLKETLKTDKERYHFIRRGLIVSVTKTASTTTSDDT